MKKLAVMLIAVFLCANYSAADEKNVPTVAVSSADAVKEIEGLITDFYYKQDVNTRAFAEDLFIGKASSGDPHSQYFSPEQRRDFENEMRGVIYGIGVRIGMEGVRNKKFIEILLPIKEVLMDSPAERAGIRSGDYIIAVASDGIKEHLIFFKGKSPSQEASRLIQGEKGSPVYIRVLRRGKKLDFLIIRDEIKQKIVFGKFIKLGIGYIYLAEFFGDSTLEDFSVLVSSMQNNGMKVLIWDLRNNPGGRLDYAVKMSRWFQKYGDNKPIVILKGKDITLIDTGDLASILVSYLSQGKFYNLPLVIIVNRYSASASEIVVAYLKNYRGVPLVGEKTYKKGTAQSVFLLRNGGILKITTAEYFVGERKIKVDKIGVSPTIEIKNPKRVRNEKEDAQFQRAIQEAEKLIK